MDVLFAVSTDATGAFALDEQIDDDDSLLGASIAIQAFDGRSVTEPAAVVIGHAPN